MELLRKHQKEVDCRFKLNDLQRKEIITMRLSGKSQFSISKYFNVHQSTISRIVSDYFKNLNEEVMNND